MELGSLSGEIFCVQPRFIFIITRSVRNLSQRIFHSYTHTHSFMYVLLWIVHESLETEVDFHSLLASTITHLATVVLYCQIIMDYELPARQFLSFVTAITRFILRVQAITTMCELTSPLTDNDEIVCYKLLNKNNILFLYVICCYLTGCMYVLILSWPLGKLEYCNWNQSCWR